MTVRPEWWHFEIVFSPHVIERMQDRGFSEVEVRAMLDDADAHSPSAVPGRFVIRSSRDRESWEIVVEPDDIERSLIVVTAYRVE